MITSLSRHSDRSPGSLLATLAASYLRPDPSAALVTPAFRGAALEAQRITAREWIVSGPSETGKTWATLWRLDTILRTTPRARGAIVRKVRADIDGSVLDTYRTVVAMSGSGAMPYGGNEPRWFDYPNGARCYIGGMDRPGKVLSGERDVIYVNQAEELDRADWEVLTTRTTGRGAVYAHPMLFGDCNPGPPTHWILSRRDAGHLVFLHSRHEDNPSLHDGTAWTEQGRRTLATLAALTGIDAARLGRGEWSAAEGQVYDTWSDGPADGNVTEAAEYVPGADVYWFVDDGYSAGSAKATRGIDPHTAMYVADSHPRVFLLAQLRADGRLCVFAEDYACLTLSDRHIARVQELGPAGSDEPYPEPERVIYGPGAAEIRGRLVDAELSPRQSGPSVAESIKELRRAFAPDANGWRRVLVHPRCAHLRRELASYQYEPGSEKPLKQFDHGPDALRVGFWALRREL